MVITGKCRWRIYGGLMNNAPRPAPDRPPTAVVRGASAAGVDYAVRQRDDPDYDGKLS